MLSHTLPSLSSFPPGDIWAMLLCNMAHISIKQGGWAGLTYPGARVIPPKSDTNPLTKAKHLYYIPPDWPATHPKPKGGTHNPGGSPTPAPEDSTSKPIPKGGPHAAPRLKRTTPSPHTKGPGSPFPHQPSGDGRSTDYARQAPSCDALPIQRFPSSGAFTPAHCAPVSRVGQPTPGLARSSCPCLSRRPRHPSTRRMHRDAGYESPPQAVSSPSAVRSCAAAGGISPTQP